MPTCCPIFFYYRNLYNLLTLAFKCKSPFPWKAKDLTLLLFLLLFFYKALRDRDNFFWLGPIKETKNQMEQVIIMVLRATLTSQQMLRWFCVNGEKKIEHIKDKDFDTQVIALHRWRIASIFNVKASLSYLFFFFFFW